MPPVCNVHGKSASQLSYKKNKVQRIKDMTTLREKERVMFLAGIARGENSSSGEIIEAVKEINLILGFTKPAPVQVKNDTMKPELGDSTCK